VDLRGLLKGLLANILFLDLLLFQMLNAHPFLEGKQNRQKIDTFRRIAKTTGKQIEYSGNPLLFFSSRRNQFAGTRSTPQKNFGEML